MSNTMPFSAPVSRLGGVLLLVLLLAGPIRTAHAQFVDATVAAGVNTTHLGPGVADMRIGTGAAWFDFDNDGDLDLYMTNRSGANLLYQNSGSGGAYTFSDVAAAMGVQDTGHDGAGVAVADFDNDGDDDLYLANSNADVLFKNTFIENGTPGFTDITTGSGLESSGVSRGTSASWGDYNNDGYLDLYVAHHTPIPAYGGTTRDRLYLNNGDGATFTDVTDLIVGDVDGDGLQDTDDEGFIASWTDFDGDGDLDILLMNDCPFPPDGSHVESNKLWRNDGGTDPVTDWTFTEVSESLGADQCQNAMGIAVGDPDRDGDFDYFFTNIGGATFLQNDGGTFTNQTAAVGLFEENVPPGNYMWVTWGTIFFDYDLDGFQDLIFAAGNLPPEAQSQPNPLYRNDGDGTFTKVVNPAPGTLWDHEGKSRTIVMGDYNQDGAPDLFIVNIGEETRLVSGTNDDTNNWMIVDLVGAGAPYTNKDGVGAKVTLRTRPTSGSAGNTEVTQYYEIHSGSTLGGGDDRAGYFGVGTHAYVREIEVAWPSGLIQRITEPSVNSRLTITEDSGTPYFVERTSGGGVTRDIPRITHDGVTGSPDMGIGTGAAWFDYDNDGDLDLYVTMRNGANLLFANNGAGSYTEVAGAAGAEDATHDGAGVAVADYDNDGDDDLYLANANEDVLLKNTFIENGTPGFTDVTGLTGPEPMVLGGLSDERGTSASWGDYDGDGYVDLYVANHIRRNFNGDITTYTHEQDHLYHNNGDGTFTEVSSLLFGDVDGDSVPDLEGRGFIAAWTDVDNDGDLDIHLMNDCPFGREGNKLWINGGGTDPVTDWTFTETATAAGADYCQNAMGISVGDYNRDGNWDYYYTNGGSARLLQGAGDGTFTDVTVAAGLFDDTVPGGGANRITWGSSFVDYDLDGWQDLVVVAGTIDQTSSQQPQPNLLYHNNGDGTFTDVSAGSGVSSPLRGKTVLRGDYDADGDPDFFVVNYGERTLLLRNTNTDVLHHHWLIVDLVGGGVGFSNANGIGARVSVTAGGVTQHYEVRSGSSLGGGEDIGAYFGLGTSDVVTQIAVTWPTGITQTLNNVAGDQRMTIVEDTSPLPVELTAFGAVRSGGDVLLKWQTATETNNAGYEVQHKTNAAFQKIGYVEGMGTTTEGQAYSYRCTELAPGRHVFRLKQVDFDGASAYSAEVEVFVELPGAYELTAAYPNPFNPQAQFTLAVQQAQVVQVALYDLLGRRVQTLYNGVLEANESHSFTINGAGLSSGLYLIQVQGERFSASQRVTLLK